MDRVLDIGCGDCILTMFISTLCRAVIAVDRSVRKKGAVGKIAFCECDITDNSFQLDNIDIVLLLDVLEHIPKDKERALLNKITDNVKRLFIINIPEQSDPDQPFDRIVSPLSIVNYVSRSMKLQTYRHLPIAKDESYNFIVFRK